MNIKMLTKNFSVNEMKCRHSGKCHMDKSFMDTLQKIRNIYGKPMIITSGYRDITHPVEKAKATPGEHAVGMAVDVACFGEDALKLVEIAIQCGIKRIGLNQKGSPSGRFVHLGGSSQFPRGIWTY